jgi:hypothetical protein
VKNQAVSEIDALYDEIRPAVEEPAAASTKPNSTYMLQ